jgi:hypothetical protein
MDFDADDLRAAAKAFLAIAPCMSVRMIDEAMGALQQELDGATGSEREAILGALELLAQGRPRGSS